MENKYYTPDIEDIKAGYYCQTLHSRFTVIDNVSSYKEEWIDLIIKEFSFESSNNAIEAKTIRTPYLTKEQIEAEGWKYHADKFLESLGKEPTHFWFVKNGFGCTFYLNGRIQITNDKMQTMFPVIIFDGVCPSINEFRTICKLLNIK